jgi:DNA anti-recombination protein RmuC
MKILLLAIASALFLSACIEKTDSPRQVSEKYWQALKDGDHETARKLVSRNSQNDLDAYLELNTDQRLPLGEINLGTEQTTVTTIIHPLDSSTGIQHELETVLVFEDGQWRIDAERTQPPAVIKTDDEELDKLAQQLSESMQENLDTMDDAVNEGVQMLNETLEDGSKEMGESLLRLMNDLNDSMRESIDKMKQRRDKQKKEQIQPDPEQGEGMI